jgi:endogenous inhibitor of DNA gyrase (YacG/DUF329 family)
MTLVAKLIGLPECDVPQLVDWATAAPICRAARCAPLDHTNWLTLEKRAMVAEPLPEAHQRQELRFE